MNKSQECISAAGYAINKRTKKKRAVRRSDIAKGSVLTVLEGIDRSIANDLPITDQSTGGVEEQQIRAPRICSLCRSLEHTAYTCNLKV